MVVLSRSRSVAVQEKTMEDNGGIAEVRLKTMWRGVFEKPTVQGTLPFGATSGRNARDRESWQDDQSEKRGSDVGGALTDQKGKRS